MTDFLHSVQHQTNQITFTHLEIDITYAELTFLWNDLPIDWNDPTLERNDRNCGQENPLVYAFLSQSFRLFPHFGQLFNIFGASILQQSTSFI